MSEQARKETSEEFDERQKELAAAEGEAYQRSLRHMIEVVAHTGEMVTAGEYIVGFAQEEAEGLYHLTDDGEFEWTEPSGEENCHLEVAVADAADGRFVPEASVTATLAAHDDGEVGPVDMDLLWHPGLYHYGENIHLPGDGTYDIEITVDPPTFRRHDETNGDRYGESVTVRFEDVDVKTGQS
ncbi:iron transporter [Haloarcula sp. S1CR25-12]|uniref:Iron transporter n=1 Tax=Haloarcula saliterrae TaxID=2950534 RepID=A0ABU2FHX7_9EURY|nr:iron transporter [Haloarcula sp. S1CR25-12]MDS0261305.1 iron transporter [Haloarcula sp. S1CR25-12]